VLGPEGVHQPHITQQTSAEGVTLFLQQQQPEDRC
jgi:hypothetical protein